MKTYNDSLNKIEEMKAKSSHEQKQIDLPLELLPVDYLHDDKRKIFMSNDLIRSIHSFNLTQRRIISLALASVNTMEASLRSRAIRAQGWSVKITALEFSKQYKVDPSTAYLHLQSNVETLRTSYFGFRIQSKIPNKPDDVLKINWMKGVMYSAGEGYITLIFNPEVAKHLLSLKKHFTNYLFSQATKFRSLHTWRLFDLIMSWKSEKVWRVDMGTLHDALSTPEGARNDFGMFRRDILNKSIKEIHKHTDVEIEYTTKKTGNKVTGLIFHILHIPEDEQGDEPNPALLN